MQRRTRRKRQKSDDGDACDKGIERQPQPSCLLRRNTTTALGRDFTAVCAEPWLDDPFRDQDANDNQHQARHHCKIEVRGQIDRICRVQQMDRVVGDFCQDRIDRNNQKIDTNDPGESRRQPGQRVPAEAQEAPAPSGIRIR